MCDLLYFATFLFVFDQTYGIPSYCHDYYTEFSLQDGYNRNIDPDVNVTVSEITYLYNVVEVGNYFTCIFKLFIFPSTKIERA